MSYPEPHYLGDTGEIDFRFRPAGTAPELTNGSGGSTSYLAKGEATRGQFGLYRMVLGPKQPGPVGQASRLSLCGTGETPVQRRRRTHPCAPIWSSKP